MSYPTHLFNRFEYIFPIHQINTSKPQKYPNHKKNKKVRFCLQPEYIFYTRFPEQEYEPSK